MPLKPMGQPKGDFSRINIKAMELALDLQARANDAIRDQFGMSEPGLSIAEGFTLGEFQKALDAATKAGKRDEFDAMLGQQFVQALQQQQQQQAQQQAQQQQKQQGAQP